MTKLNTTAKNIQQKYIRTTSPGNLVDTRKKRGVQAEINKLDAIRKSISDTKTVIEFKELARLKAELHKLAGLVDSLMVSSIG